MTLPVADFVNPEPGSFAYSAVRKALKEKPRVRLIGRVDLVDYFLVEKTSALGLRRIVQVWEDADGELWVECSCPAGTPREDAHYGTIMWQPKPCYHEAAVLIHVSQNKAL